MRVHFIINTKIGQGAYRATVPGIYKACTANLDPFVYPTSFLIKYVLVQIFTQQDRFCQFAGSNKDNTVKTIYEENSFKMFITVEHFCI